MAAHHWFAMLHLIVHVILVGPARADGHACDSELFLVLCKLLIPGRRHVGSHGWIGGYPILGQNEYRHNGRDDDYLSQSQAAQGSHPIRGKHCQRQPKKDIVAPGFADQLVEKGLFDQAIGRVEPVLALLADGDGGA